VERLGIERSHRALASADAVLLLVDLSEGWTEADAALAGQLPAEVPVLVVGNKADRAVAATPAQVDVVISALTGSGLEALADALLGRCGLSLGPGIEVALNARQCDLAASAAESLGGSLAAAAEDLPWDFWTIDLRQAARSLGEITGEEVNEAVLDRVFSRFCIGK
jgi:tRNA modification GTPase